MHETEPKAETALLKKHQTEAIAYSAYLIRSLNLSWSQSLKMTLSWSQTQSQRVKNVRLREAETEAKAGFIPKPEGKEDIEINAVIFITSSFWFLVTNQWFAKNMYW